MTGVSAADDGNSYWRVRGRTAAVCRRGTPVRCGQAIRLTHLGTGRNLHSHRFTSPLSGNQVPDKDRRPAPQLGVFAWAALGLPCHLGVPAGVSLSPSVLPVFSLSPVLLPAPFYSLVILLGSPSQIPHMPTSGS